MHKCVVCASDRQSLSLFRAQEKVPIIYLPFAAPRYLVAKIAGSTIIAELEVVCCQCGIIHLPQPFYLHLCWCRYHLYCSHYYYYYKYALPVPTCVLHQQRVRVCA